MSNMLNKPAPKGCLYVVWVLVVLFFLMLIGNGIVIVAAYHLLCGWVSHGLETLPPFLAQWRVAVFPFGCLVLATWLTHTFICRWAKAKRPDLTWRIKYTVSIFALLFLSSAAAIAMSGIVHQFFWLSKEDVIERRGRSERAHVISSARNLSQVIHGVFNMNQRYPSSLDELEEYVAPNNNWYSKKGEGVPEPFILLQPRSKDKLEDDEVILVSPYIQSMDQYAVGYGDGSVSLVGPAMLKRILNKSEEETITPHE